MIINLIILLISITVCVALFKDRARLRLEVSDKQEWVESARHWQDKYNTICIHKDDETELKLIQGPLNNYKDLSFYNQPSILNAYGIPIPLLGVGPLGIWISAASNEKNQADAQYWNTPINEVHEEVLEWSEICEYFPNHKEEIISAYETK